MAKKPHPADLADLAAIDKAPLFTIWLKMGQGSPLRFEQPSLKEAIRAAVALEAQHRPKRALVYAVNEGLSYVVPRALFDQIAGSL